MKPMLKPPSPGKNIRKLRNQQALSLDELSKKSGVSKAMLSQVESEKANPTIATVWKIAYGLGVEFNVLVRGDVEPARKFKINRRENITSLDIDKKGVHINVLSPISMAEDLELYLLTFEPQGILDSAPHYPGTMEFLTLIEGRARISAGKNSTELHEGDFIMYHCDVKHSIENISRRKAKIHLVVMFNKDRKEGAMPIC
jgi:transcriptional regulator with XRE-family HTH domain